MMPTLANKQFNFSNYIRSYICTVIVCKVFAQIMLAKLHCGVCFRYIFASMLSNILYVQFIHFFFFFIEKYAHIHRTSIWVEDQTEVGQDTCTRPSTARKNILQIIYTI